MKISLIQLSKIFWLMVFAVTFCSTSLLGQDFVWTQTSAPNTNWYSVASSSDGTKLVAVTLGEFANGGIYISTDSGTTWTQTSAAGAGWLSVASSSDGTKLVAASINRSKVDETLVGGFIITSTNSGTTWTQSSAPTNENWQSVAQPKQTPNPIGAAYSDDVAPERSFGIDVILFYKYASPTGLKNPCSSVSIRD